MTNSAASFAFEEVTLGAARVWGGHFYSQITFICKKIVHSIFICNLTFFTTVLSGLLKAIKNRAQKIPFS